ncbi:MAG: ABC transporter ATP-binding protein [Candidatus Heimdallarchaeota archaeon]
MQHILRCEKVWKIYNPGSRAETVALKNVSLSIKKGERISIIGPSGCGKSTLLHILGLLDRPTRGKVFINGSDASRMSDKELAKARREKIGFVFQFFYLVPTLTALENVILPMSLKGVAKDKKIQRAKRLLELVGVEKKFDNRPNELSGGERQRVAIARAMANEPQIILADEPTGNLDSVSGREVMNILMKLNKEEKVTLVIVTHDKNIASQTKRIIYLKDGEIVKEVKK